MLLVKIVLMKGTLRYDFATKELQSINWRSWVIFTESLTFPFPTRFLSKGVRLNLDPLIGSRKAKSVETGRGLIVVQAKSNHNLALPAIWFLDLRNLMKITHGKCMKAAATYLGKMSRFLANLDFFEGCLWLPAASVWPYRLSFSHNLVGFKQPFPNPQRRKPEDWIVSNAGKSCLEFSVWYFIDEGTGSLTFLEVGGQRR